MFVSLEICLCATRREWEHDVIKRCDECNPHNGVLVGVVVHHTFEWNDALDTLYFDPKCPHINKTALHVYSNISRWTSKQNENA